MLCTQTSKEEMFRKVYLNNRENNEKTCKSMWKEFWQNNSHRFACSTRRLWNRMLDRMRVREPQICSYIVSNHNPCKEFVGRNSKRFCDEHERLRRKYHKAYHFVLANKTNRYLDVGHLKNDRSCTEDEQNTPVTLEQQQRRNVLVVVETNTRKNYDHKFNFTPNMGHEQWYKFLDENYDESVDDGILYKIPDPNIDDSYQSDNDLEDWFEEEFGDGCNDEYGDLM